MDLYYMDLDGEWSDADKNGWLDTHEGTVAPELWLGRITTNTRLTPAFPHRTETNLVRDYFSRNHAYRMGQLRVEPNALGFIDDDWVGAGADWNLALGSTVDGELVSIIDPEETTAANYRQQLSLEWEHVLLAAHSSPIWHSLGGEAFWTNEVVEIDPQVLFYNLFACSAARYDRRAYIGGEYVFGTSSTLLAVGSAKTGGMLDSQDYFAALAAGDTFGTAYKRWWDGRAAEGFTQHEVDFSYGMTMLGDPLLVTQRYIPEPASWLLLDAGIGLLSLARCRGRRD